MSLFERSKRIPSQHDSFAETDDIEYAPASAVSPLLGTARDQYNTIGKYAANTESQKPAAHSTDLGEEGAKRTELMQEVWGKHGKLYIFLSYVYSSKHLQ